MGGLALEMRGLAKLRQEGRWYLQVSSQETLLLQLPASIVESFLRYSVYPKYFRSNAPAAVGFNHQYYHEMSVRLMSVGVERVT